MKKHFYSRLINIDSLLVRLEALKLKEEEKAHLHVLIEANMQSKVLDTVLSHLTEEDKKALLQFLHHEDHDAIWDLIHEKIMGVEEKIREAADELKKTFLEDIQKVLEEK